MNSAAFANEICKQFAEVFNKPTSRPAALNVLVDEIAAVAKRNGKVFVFSVGREGLMLKAFCMRLYHLGLRAHCVFDMNTPPCTASDLLIASAGPGGHSTIDAICARGQKSGARVVLMTAQPENGSAAKYASAIAYLPAQTMANDQEEDTCKPCRALLPMGSIYEGAMFILCEMVIYKVSEILNQSPDQIRDRHTNLE